MNWRRHGSSDTIRVKGLSPEELETRSDLVFALPERIPDGTETAAKKAGEWGTSTSHKNIKLDSSVSFSSKTEESSQFRKEYQMRKLKQELDRQLPLIGEIETKVDKVTSDIKSNNVRLKENLNKVRSSWNFIFDVILLCIVLGIAFYLYNMKLHILMRVVINIPNQESTLHINRVN
ncbi:syntaxin-71-like isoform X3 [Pyrus x bretschneideri]|uniref:syntaxin-71-like isoform X3 n=1 Tax=Pyrus x bretschneideri TaxID=225117 RepID=UPI00202E917F|nr:syntaxin-71-like isoform X3 [Pyrus x bretschneideri]